MNKIDFKRELKDLYRPSATEFSLVDVPSMQYLMVDGHGDPNRAQEYQEAVESLYAVAYKLKFNSKKGLEKDYVVPPLEGLWWAEDMDSFSSARDKSQWDWTMMILTPDWISLEMFQEAIALVRKGKNPAALDKVRLESYDEGFCVQILYIGSYDDEGPTLLRLHQEFGLARNGFRHDQVAALPGRLNSAAIKENGLAGRWKFDLRFHACRQREQQFKRFTFLPINRNRTAGCWDFSLRKRQVAQVGTYQNGFPARRNRPCAEYEPGQQVRRCGTPGMVPILVGFVFVIPGFPGYRRAALHHVPPAAIAGRDHLSERDVGCVVLEQGLHQILGDIHRAGHPLAADPVGDPLAIRIGHKAEGEREQIGVERCVIGVDSIHIHPAPRIEQLLLE